MEARETIQFETKALFLKKVKMIESMSAGAWNSA